MDINYDFMISVVLLFLLLNNYDTTLAQMGDDSKHQLVSEDDYYRIVTLPVPRDIVLEVSGMHLLPTGSLVVTTRYGEVWLIEDPYMDGNAQPNFRKIASGLHTPMGITSKDGKLYVAQRSELSELSDTNGDGEIDQYRTFCTFEMSGNYCEYVHGPILLPDGSFWVNMNLADNGWFTREPFFGEMGHHAPWKGWAVKITPEGELKPIASGLRSPPGMGIGKNGTLYYSENQGGWVGTGYVTTLDEGDFFGHPSSLKSASLPKSNIDLRPEDIPDQDSLLMHEAVKKLPQLKMPSVRLPHGVMGTSTSWILQDTTKGAFGPFEEQLFVADQGQSKIMRVFTEVIKGKTQGAAFQFRKGFKSGIIRSTWGRDGSMFVGMTDRGWKSSGPDSEGLQRLVWTGKIPFEIKAIRAKSDGFELEFTKPVDLQTTRTPNSYQLSSFDYLFGKQYGSPPVDQKSDKLKGIILSEDRYRVRLVFEYELREGYIYQINSRGIKSEEGDNILHPDAYYSLNQIPDGEKANLTENQLITEEREEIPHEDSDTEATIDQNKNQTSLPEEWSDELDQVINIGTLPGLTYDKDEFEVKAGSRVKLVFNNSDDLLHNLLITTPGSATGVGEEALNMGIEGPEKDYVPEMDQVLFFVSLLQPGSSEEIYFEVPSEPGEYQYVCTYPGHYTTMRGIMKVIP